MATNKELDNRKWDAFELCFGGRNLRHMGDRFYGIIPTIIWAYVHTCFYMDYVLKWIEVVAVTTNDANIESGHNKSSTNQWVSQVLKP